MLATDRRTIRDAERRRAIVAAARDCFLRFGYEKTSLDDVARVAGISRPLIYRKFANKEAIFAAVFEDTFAARYPRAEAAAQAAGPASERLLRVYEILLIEPWDEVMRAPMAAEFFAACSRLLPEVEALYQRLTRRCVQSILGSRELADIFQLAAEGMQSDLPTTRVLRRRLRLLAERFAG